MLFVFSLFVGCATVRSPRYREDPAGKSCGPPHWLYLHQGVWFRASPEVHWRGWVPSSVYTNQIHFHSWFIFIKAILLCNLNAPGARMVRELFVMAREHAPSIIFMDEIDSIGSSRLEGGSGGDSEVQRTMLELLNQLDGFEATKNIKVSHTQWTEFVWQWELFIHLVVTMLTVLWYIIFLW